MSTEEEDQEQLNLAVSLVTASLGGNFTQALKDAGLVSRDSWDLDDEAKEDEQQPVSLMSALIFLGRELCKEGAEVAGMGEPEQFLHRVAARLQP